MNKYIVKATAQISAVIVFSVAVSLVTLQVLEYFQPTALQVVSTLGVALLVYTLYNLVIIQADILRSRDNLNK
jgi:threonine/homoserine/homoserine lactone efflux protein